MTDPSRIVAYEVSPFSGFLGLVEAVADALGGSGHKTHPLYLRFGGLPPGGRSSTWRREWIASGRTPPFGFDSPHFPQYDLEPGVSVFRARRLPYGSPSAYECDVSPSVDLFMLFRDLANSGRRPYLVRGTELPETGFLDEPLLADASARPLPRGTVVTCTRHFSAPADPLRRRRR